MPNFIDPFDNDGEDSGLGFRVPRPRPEWRRPLPSAQADSAIRALADKGLSGMSYIASSLDKPGRAVRGLLAGRPRDLLAAVPFSDTLGITDPEDQVSGRDLLDKAGITSKNDKGWIPWGAGIATEMATDPLSYITLGAKHALTPLGKALESAGHLRGISRENMIRGFAETESGLARAGMTAEQAAHEMRRLPGRIATKEMEDAAARAGQSISPGAPLGGTIGIGLPFQSPTAVLGTGPTAQKLARFADRAADKMVYGNAIGRTINRWFDPEVLDSVDALTQRAAKRTAPIAEAAKVAARDLRTSLTSDMKDAVRLSGGTDEELARAATLAGEKQPMIGVANPEVERQGRIIGGKLRSEADRQIEAYRQAGAPLSDLGDEFAAYLPREGMSVDRSGIQATPHSVINPLGTGANMRRKDPLRGIPGGTTAIDDWTKRYGGKKATPKTRDEIFKDMVEYATTNPNYPLVQFTPEFQDHLNKKAKRLAKMFAGMDPVHSEHGIPFFTPNRPHVTELRRMREGSSVRHAAAATEAVVDAAVRGKGKGLVPLGRALRQIGLKTTYEEGQAAKGALVNALRSLARKGEGDISGALSDPKALKLLAKSWSIPQGSLDQITRSYNKWITPTSISGPMMWADTLNNLFKNSAYSVWIPSHVRNLVSAGVTNAMNGVRLGDMRTAYNVMRDTATAPELIGMNLGMPAVLSDEAARDWIRSRAYATANIFGGHNSAHDVAGTGDELVESMSKGGSVIPDIPGSNRTGDTGSLAGDMLGLLREGVLGRRDPVTGERVTSPLSYFKQAGVIDKSKGALRTKDEWSPLAAGRIAGTNIEDFSRLANWIGGVRQGMSHEQAGRFVNKLHFDYGNLTNFERNVMRRLVPFYTFQSRNLPLQLEYMLHRPSMLTSQLRPLSQMQAGYKPQYLSSGVAIPVGDEQNGTQRYISSIGIPIEEAFERMKFSGGLPDVRQTAMAYASGLTPYIKGPLEQVFNMQLNTGRKLTDLRPSSTGRLFGALSEDGESSHVLSQMVANTPLTRFASMIDRMADERKGLLPKALGALTGVKVSDVETDKMRAIEARNALQEMLDRAPHLSSYTNFYVKPEDASNMTAEEIAKMRLFAVMQDRAREYADRKRRQQSSGD